MEELFGNRGRNGNGDIHQKYMGHDLEFVVDEAEPIVLRIEKDIPIPSKARGADPTRPLHPIAEALQRMSVGDSILIPPSLVVKTKSIVNSMRKRLAKKNTKVRVIYTVRAEKTSKNSRIWRIQ
jgi:hypothetical protein